MAEQSAYYRFPALDATPEDIKSFHNRYFSRYSTYRSRHMQRIATSLYYILGRQWIERDNDILPEGARGFALRDMAPDENIELPRPVTNLIAPAIDVEFATLSKRQWVPKIPTYSRDPRMEAAAKVADDVLNDRLKKLDWEDLRDRFILNLCHMGTATFHSFWEESYYQTAWVSVPEPHSCPACGSLLASRSVPQSLALALQQGGGVGTMRDSDENEEEVELQNCPTCAGELQRTDLSEEQSHLLDAFGRPLGEDLPKGGTAIELITPFEYYPQNAGVGVTPETIRQHGIAKVRSLDWIEEHHPDLIDKVEPEPVETLMREHPLLGEWDIIGRYDYSLDAGIYDHHAMVYDLYADPSYRFKEGRAIRIIGTTQQLIARNEPLVRKVQGSDGKEAAVPIAIVASAVWKPREGEFWGKTLADDLLSPQNRINGIDAQTIEARERMGSPNLMTPDDSDLEGPEFRAGFGLGKIFKYRPSVINPAAKPEVFGAVTMPSGVALERQACVESMTKIIGPADIEIGEAPRNITTTSGLQILGEQAERRRATRERGITSAFKKIWRHQLDLLWTLRVDSDTYESKLPDGSWEIKQYDREAIGGQTKVEIERQAYIDRSIIVRESTRQALLDGLYDASTPTARKKLLELMGLPTDVNEDTNLQIDHARRQWVDFVDDGKVPVIDLTLDNALIRFHVLGTMLMQDEGLRISEDALWPQISPIIAGWEDQHARLSMVDQMTREQYGGEPPKEQAAEQYAQMTMSYQESKAAYDQSVQMKMNAPPGMPPPDMSMQAAPPQPPLPPVFLPQQPEQRIFLVWQNTFQNKLGPQGLAQLVLKAATEKMADPMEMTKKVNSFLRFRAVVEAYKLMSGPSLAPGSTPGAMPVPEGGPGGGPPQGGPPPPGAGAPPPGMAPPGPSPTQGTPPQPPTPVGA